MTSQSAESGPNHTRYYPWWLDKLADDVTGEGAAIQGVIQGAESVHTVVTDARKIYENQTIEFTGNYGADSFLEEYTCNIQGQATRVVVTVKRNAAGECQHLVVNHRPRNSVLLFARLMGKTYAGTALAKYFVSNES